MAELELRRGPEPATNLDFRLLPGTSNSRVKEALNSLGTRFTDPAALEPVLGLFAPLEPSGERLTAKLEPRSSTGVPPAENLWEQVYLAYQTYPYLEKPDQQHLLALTGRALEKLTLPLPRQAHGETKVLTPHVRNRAQEVSGAFQAFQKDELGRLAERQRGKKPPLKVPRLVARLAPLLSLVAGACGPMTTPRPPDIGAAVTPRVTEVRPLPSPTHEAPPTPLPGGPETPVVAPWPSSLSQIPETVAGAGGAFTLETSAPNVLAQREAVAAKLQASGWTLVETPNQLTSGQTAFVSPMQEGKRWAITALTQDGFMMPVDQAGKVMDRPDWATSNVARYTEIADRLGSGYNRRFELVNDHWVPVTRNGKGRLVAFYDVVAQEWRYNQELIPQQEKVLIYGNGITSININEALTGSVPLDRERSLIFNGQPLADGTIFYTKETFVGATGMSEQPTALVAARIIGGERVGIVSFGNLQSEEYVIYYGIQLTPQKHIIIAAAIFDYKNQETYKLLRYFSLPGGDATGVNLNQADPQHNKLVVLPFRNFAEWVISGQARGQQVLLMIAYNLPSSDRRAGENAARQALITAIEQRQLPATDISLPTWPATIGSELVLPEEILQQLGAPKP